MGVELCVCVYYRMAENKTHNEMNVELMCVCVCLLQDGGERGPQQNECGGDVHLFCPHPDAH